MCTIRPDLNGNCLWHVWHSCCLTVSVSIVCNLMCSVRWYERLNTLLHVMHFNFEATLRAISMPSVARVTIPVEHLKHNTPRQLTKHVTSSNYRYLITIIHQIQFWLGPCPGPHWGSLQHPLSTPLLPQRLRHLDHTAYGALLACQTGFTCILKSPGIFSLKSRPWKFLNLSL